MDKSGSRYPAGSLDCRELSLGTPGEIYKFVKQLKSHKKTTNIYMELYMEPCGTP